MDADTAGLIEKFVGYNYKLTRTDYDLLKRLSVELKTVTKELDGQIIANFSLTMLLKTVVQNIDELEFFYLIKTKRDIEKKTLKTQWILW